MKILKWPLRRYAPFPFPFSTIHEKEKMGFRGERREEGVVVVWGGQSKKR